MMTRAIQTCRADFKERSRRRSYLVILLLMTIITLLFFPDVGADYATVMVGGYRGIYNSAWVGGSLAILCVTFLPIICFVLVKNALETDRNSLACELIGATSVSKFDFIFGKWLSNLLLLIGIMAVMTVTSAVVQLWYGESYYIDIVSLLAPQLILVLPILALIAAVSLLFETLPWLRGGMGNIVYFFLWAVFIVGSIENSAGVSEVIAQIKAAVMAHDPSVKDSVSIGVSFNQDGSASVINTFIWQGIEYRSKMLLEAAGLLLASMVVVLLATVFFDRFRQVSQVATDHRGNVQLIARLMVVVAPLTRGFEAICKHSTFTRLMRQEYLMMFRGGSPWWYLILIGLGISQLAAPLENVRLFIIPMSWLLCVLALSPLGQREKHQGADPLVFSCPSPMKLQFPAMLLAGFLLAITVVSPVLLRFILLGEWFSVLMLCSGGLFMTSLALACGALTRTSRTFEIVFVMLWYVGPMQHSGLDFVGVYPQVSMAAGAPLSFLIASLVLLAGAWQGRLWQLQR
ncbi:MAG: hypothetical protein ACI88A_000950 [Paraglaciecola sp.]|jgi:hypothetical protein